MVFPISPEARRQRIERKDLFKLRGIPGFFSEVYVRPLFHGSSQLTSHKLTLTNKATTKTAGFHTDCYNHILS